MHAPAPAPDRTLPGAHVALLLICLAACVLFLVAAIRFYFGTGFAHAFNSDAAVSALLANEILRTGQLLPASWYFVNNELWTVSAQVFVMPFVAALGVSTLAVKLGNMLCIGTMVAFVALPLHRITRSWPYAILVAAGVFSAFSAFQESAVYSQTAYGWFSAQFAILIHLALRMQDESATEPRPVLGRTSWATALYGLVLLNLASDSPLRAGVYWVVPLLVVVMLFPFSRKRSWALAAWTAAVFAAGVVLHGVLGRQGLMQPGITTQLLKPIGEWRANLSVLAGGVPSLIGFAKLQSATLFGALGAARFCFFSIAAVVVLFAPVGNGPGSTECRFFARVCGAMLIVVLAVLTVGRLATDAGAMRYLLPPALLCVAAFMTILWCRLGAKTYGTAAIAALFVLAFCGGAVLLVSRDASIASPCDAPTNICRLESLIATTGVHHGYATYWNANVTTVASNGEIAACGVVLAPKLVPFRWLVSKACFDTSHDDRYFLALDRAEIAKAGREHLVSEAGTPDRVVTDTEYEVWIYETATARADWLQR
ncbi:MAG TPA: hypothetical protein VFV97_01080 [Rhodanobacteraceae bacterium]|nr:hypothetical protein [Rhodanobacteraceae bacterium]